MTKNIGSVSWQQTASFGRAALLTLDSAIDQNWNITINGTDETGTPVKASHVVIDNLANNALLTFAYGPFLYRISPYTRKTFPILTETDTCQFNITLGSVDVIFCNFDPKIPDDTNQVQTTSSGSGAIFITRLINQYTGVVAQSQADNNSILNFAPNAGNMTYTLLSPGDASAAWFNPAIFVYPAVAFNLTIDAGAAVINKGNSQVNSFIVTAGQSFMLSSDGAQWYAHSFT